jgi:hypothetical protein
VSEPEPRRPFGGALFGRSDPSLPSIPRSIGQGVLAIITTPALVAIAIVVPFLAWIVLVALGFEGSPARLVDVLALPPISTYFDLGTGASLAGLGTGFLVFTGVAIVVRGLITALLTGWIVEAVEDRRVSRYGLYRGVAAIPTVLLVQVASFSLIVLGNLIFPALGPGIGFLAFVAALVGGLFFLGFAPAAAVRQGRPATDTIRRSARAAMLPGTRQLMLCALYFFIALPVVVGFAPGGKEVTANPQLSTWIAALLVNVLHLAFMATFAYRWIAIEPIVPEEPVRLRRTQAPPPAARKRR